MFSPQPIHTAPACPSASPPNAIETELLAESVEVSAASFESASSANYETALRRIFKKDERPALADKSNADLGIDTCKGTLDIHIVASEPCIEQEEAECTAEVVAPEPAPTEVDQAKVTAVPDQDTQQTPANPTLEEVVKHEPVPLSPQQVEEEQNLQQQHEDHARQEEQRLMRIEAEVLQAADVAIKEADSMMVNKTIELQKQLDKRLAMAADAVEQAAIQAQTEKESTLSHLKGVYAAKRIAALQAIEVQATQDQKRLVIEAAREKTAAERVAADQAVQTAQKLTSVAQTESDEANSLPQKREELEDVLNAVTAAEKDLTAAQASKQTLAQLQAKATEAAKLAEQEKIEAAEKQAKEQKRQASTQCQAEAMKKIADAAAGADNSTDAGMIAAQAFVERKAAEQAAFAKIDLERLQLVEAACRQKEEAIEAAGAGAVQLAIKLQKLQSRHEQLTEKAADLRKGLAAACAAALAQTKTAVEDAERVAEEQRVKMVSEFNSSSKGRVVEGHARLIGRRAAGEVAAYGMERLQLFEAGEAVEQTRLEAVVAAKEHCAKEETRLRRNWEHMSFEAATESEASKEKLKKEAVAETELQKEVAKMQWSAKLERETLDASLREAESNEITRVKASAAEQLKRAIKLLRAEAKNSEAHQLLQARASRVDALEKAQQGWDTQLATKISEAEIKRDMAFAVAKFEAEMQVAVAAAKRREAKEVKHAEKKAAHRLQRDQEKAISEAQQLRREGFLQVEMQLVKATASARARFQDALGKARTQIADEAHKKMEPARLAAVQKGREAKLIEAEQRKAEDELVKAKEAVEVARARAQTQADHAEAGAREKAAEERKSTEAEARAQATKLIAEATSAVLDESTSASDAISPTKAGCDIAAVMSKVVESRKGKELEAMRSEEHALAVAKIASEQFVLAALKPYEEALENLAVSAAVAAERSESARRVGHEAQELAKATLMEAQSQDEKQLELVTEELGKILEQEQAQARRSAQQELEALKLDADHRRQVGEAAAKERSEVGLLEANTATALKRATAEKSALAAMEQKIAEMRGEISVDAAATGPRASGASTSTAAHQTAGCEKPSTWGSWLFGSGSADDTAQKAAEGSSTAMVETVNDEGVHSNTAEEVAIESAPDPEVVLGQQPKVHQMLSFDNLVVRSGGVLKGVMVLVLPSSVPASSVRIQWSGVESAGDQQTSILADETVLWMPVEDSTKGTVLPAGCHHFPFSWKLPVHLPRSHQQSCDVQDANDTTPPHSIKYSARAIVLNDGGSTTSVAPIEQELVVRECIDPNNTQMWPLAQAHFEEPADSMELVADLADTGGFQISRGAAESVTAREGDASAVPMIPLSLNQPVERSATQTYMFGGGQPCVASVQLCTPTLVPGHTSKVTLHVLNGSTRSIGSFKYRLIAVTSFMEEAMGQKMLERLQLFDGEGVNEGVEGANQNCGSSTIIERRSVVVGAFHPKDMNSGQAVRSIGPMQSLEMGFELRMPAGVQSSVLHGRRISVRHVLAVEMSNQGVDTATLAVELPVCVVDGADARHFHQDPQV
jgi:hypothetical protein